MNEYERRLIEIVQRHTDLKGIVSSLGRSSIIEHFSYTAQVWNTVDSAPFGTGVSTVLTMQSDAWFVLQAISSCVGYVDNFQWFLDSGGIQVEITDLGAGQVMFFEPGSAGVLTATISRPQTGIPFILPIPRLIAPNTSIKIDATRLIDDGSGGQPNGFFVNLIGSRVTQV
jgi:hypothetical protein